MKNNINFRLLLLALFFLSPLLWFAGYYFYFLQFQPHNRLPRKPHPDDVPFKVERFIPPSAPSAPSEPTPQKPPAPPRQAEADPFAILQATLAAADTPAARLAAAIAYLTRLPDDPHAPEVRSVITQANLDLALSELPQPYKTGHLVGPGDSLDRVARQHDSTSEWIIRVNGMTSPLIRADQRLLVPSLPLELDIRLSEKRLVATTGGQFFLEFPLIEINLPSGFASPPPTKVSEKRAFFQGRRVKLDEPGYYGGARQVTFTDPKFPLLYSQTTFPGSDGQPAPNGPAPKTGVALPPAAIEELFPLLTSSTTVKITP